MTERRRHAARTLSAILATLCLALSTGAPASALDLSAARVEQLDNGLTLILLENHSQPLVSVQMLYRTGARDETAGKTGLAHFLEHMAFRESEHFPDTGLVSSIYAVGGEWHGYTWLDQTTYFSTVPSSELELILRIEADRMGRLTIPEADVAFERGAVLTELHSYENDPNSVLQDHVLYQSFMAHPYRNNTIGWESDVSRVSHADLVAFYQQHYRPANAILAIVGDIRPAQVRDLVKKLFSDFESGDFEGRAPTPRPHTIEPLQTGTRRIELHGAVDRKYFKMAYHAPGVRHPDYAAFLLMQELLSAGSGVSFLQNDWGTPARAGSPLAGISDDINTWFPPSDQDYVFIISGSVSIDRPESSVEQAIEDAINGLKTEMEGKEGGERLEQARNRVQRELVFDVQTTEDAAHQLAFFAGFDALDVLIDLPDRLAPVETGDIITVLERYLEPYRATIGWYVPGNVAPSIQARQEPASSTNLQLSAADLPSTALIEPVSTPVTAALSNGTPVILQRSPLSPTAMLSVIVPSADFNVPADASIGAPAAGLASFDFELLPEELAGAIEQVRVALQSTGPGEDEAQAPTKDPSALLALTLREVVGTGNLAMPGNPWPLLIVVTGDIDPDTTLNQLENGLGQFPQDTWQRPPAIKAPVRINVEIQLESPVAQEQLGYVGLVPGPREQTFAAAQMALYVLQHGYEGRLGKKAISDSGLVYYIDAEYNTDGTNDWISLSMGVDPDKMPAMQALLRAEIARLSEEPPTVAELDEARNHLVGRCTSEAQSNPELAHRLVRQWLQLGRLEDCGQYRARLEAVSREDSLNLLPALTRGSIVSVRNPRQPSD